MIELFTYVIVKSKIYTRFKILNNKAKMIHDGYQYLAVTVFNVPKYVREQYDGLVCH